MTNDIGKLMNQTPLTEGELLAYLDGERLPHVEQQLRVSPALQQELDELRQIEQWLQGNFGGIERPDPQDLVDVALGQATATQELIVAAYVRQSPQGRRELERLKQNFGINMQGATRTARRPWFMAIPLLGSAGLKAQADRQQQALPHSRSAHPEQEGEQAFQVTEMQAQITIRIPPMIGEEWQLSGIVTQYQQPLANAKVTLRAEHTRSRSRTTDEMGFFVFRHLPEGTYRLRVYLDQGIIRVPDLVLRNRS